MDVNEALEQNEKLIHFVCKKYRKRALAIGWEYDDLFQTAAMGFVKAVQRFDDTLAKFTTYAVPMMTGEVLRWLRDWSIGPKIPRRVLEASKKIRGIGIGDLQPSEIAEQIGVDIKVVTVALGYIHSGMPLYLSQKVDDKEEKLTVGDQIGEEQDFSSIFVNDFKDTLKDKEKVLVDGILKGLTQKEIGRQIGVTQVQVSRMSRALQPKLRAYMEGDKSMFDKEMYYQLKEKGLNKSKIAKEMGMGAGSLHYYLKKHNIDQKPEVIKTEKEAVKELAKEVEEDKSTIVELEKQLEQLKNERDQWQEKYFEVKEHIQPKIEFVEVLQITVGEKTTYFTRDGKQLGGTA